MTAGDPVGRPDRQWILALLPLFPVVLLGARLWYLSRQNLQTTLLLVQEINPLGLLTALILSLMWLAPVLILVICALGALLRVSVAGETDPGRYWLYRISARIPGWVLVGATFVGMLTWQMRFLPSLLMLAVVTLALIVRERRPDRTALVRIFGVAVPCVAAITAYLWLWQAIRDSFAAHEYATASLLATPPAMMVLLTGPIPRSAARAATQWPVALLTLTPVLVGAVFVHTPILPFVALKIDTGATGNARFTVRQGYVITVDDRMTTLLDRRGSVYFIVNDQLAAKSLCPVDEEIPVSAVRVHGWQVEQTPLEWLSPGGGRQPVDPLCVGRIRSAASDGRPSVAARA